MKAAQIVGPKQIAIVDVPQPTIEGAAGKGRLPGQAEDWGSGTSPRVLVRQDLASVCGSDMPMFAHDMGDYPQPPGGFLHECVGTVVESRSALFQEGDRVLAYPDQFTGFAEFWTAKEELTIKIEGTRPLEQLLMAQPLGTVIWAVRKLGSVINKNVVVIGQGPLGLLFTHTLSNLGAKHVVGVDLFDYRLEASRRMRATHTVNPQRQDLGEFVLELTKGAGADIVVEVVGHNPDTINTAIEVVARRGTVLAFGVPDIDRYELDYAKLFRKNVALQGTVEPEVHNDFTLSLDWIEQGRVDVTPLITHRMHFTEAQKGFELSMNRADNVLKVVFDFRQ
jgi:threonine dehydrogenase-like Zn-dependent dehydrogenase